MAKFKCTACSTVTTHDLRQRSQEYFRGKKKYKSYCGSLNRTVFMMKQK